jgi:uncharacterized membrane protein (UPF0127 family)
MTCSTKVDAFARAACGVLYCVCLGFSCSTTRGADRAKSGESRSEQSDQPRAASDGPSKGKPRSGDESSRSMPQVVLMPEGREPVKVNVEIARTSAERQRGLMYRKHLDQNQGMLFIFEKPDHLSFWMRSTYIPLDMIFIEPGMRILGIVENTTPLSEERCAVFGESQYVLEVNAGFAQTHGLTRGVKVEFVGVIL